MFNFFFYLLFILCEVILHQNQSLVVRSLLSVRYSTKTHLIYIKIESRD